MDDDFLATQEWIDENCPVFTLPSRVAYLVADRKTHRARRRALSLSLLESEQPEGHRLTMRPGRQSRIGGKG